MALLMREEFGRKDEKDMASADTDLVPLYNCHCKERRHETESRVENDARQDRSSKWISYMNKM